MVFTPSIILLINSVRNKKDLKTSFLRTFGDETPLLPSPFSYISVFFFVRRLVHSCQTRWVSQDRTINFNVFPFEKKGRVSSFLASDNCNVPSCYSQTIKLFLEVSGHSKEKWSFKSDAYIMKICISQQKKRPSTVSSEWNLDLKLKPL